MTAQAPAGRQTRPSILDRVSALPGMGGGSPDGRNAPGRRSLVLSEVPPAARWLAAGAAAVIVIIVGAALLRGRAAIAALETAARTERAAAAGSGAPRAVPLRPSDAAPANALAAASTQGVLALESLATKYPKDPAVLRALMLRYASPPPFHAAALATIQRLLALAPEEAASPELQRVVAGAASGPPEAVSAALDLMSARMGNHGADLLYEVATSSAASKDRAMKLLADPAVQQRASPALRIAYELRAATTCKARQALLDRAAELGDQRATDVLAPLITAKPRGCGIFGLSRCAAPCAAMAKEIQEAIRAIEARTGPSPTPSAAPSGR